MDISGRRTPTRRAATLSPRPARFASSRVAEAAARPKRQGRKRAGIAGSRGATSSGAGPASFVAAMPWNHSLRDFAHGAQALIASNFSGTTGSRLGRIPAPAARGGRPAKPSARLDVLSTWPRFAPPGLEMLRMKSVYRYRKERHFAQPPEAIWPFVADSARINEIAGMPAYKVKERADADGRIHRLASIKYGPIRVKWEEEFGEWQENRWL